MKDGISVLATMKDKMQEDAIWCSTFQLAWDELQNNILENNFEYNKEKDILNRLIMDESAQDSISEKDYYKVVDKATKRVKKQIEEDLKKKFNEKSEIIDELEFDDDENTSKLLIYVMLKKIFQFNYEFKKLGKNKFGKENQIAEFFGISMGCDEIEKLKEQVNVLFYNSKTDYAVILTTNEHENILLYRNDENKTFEETYKEIMEKKSKNSDFNFKDLDTLKIPKLDVNVKKIYEELINEVFIRNSNKYKYTIIKALQTIEFGLDEKGGRVKSEAAIEVMFETCALFIKNEPREFNFDDTFYLYLIEEGKEKPYLAMRVNDISKFINK